MCAAAGLLLGVLAAYLLNANGFSRYADAIHRYLSVDLPALRDSQDGMFWIEAFLRHARASFIIWVLVFCGVTRLEFLILIIASAGIGFAAGSFARLGLLWQFTALTGVSALTEAAISAAMVIAGILYKEHLIHLRAYAIAGAIGLVGAALAAFADVCFVTLS